MGFQIYLPYPPFTTPSLFAKYFAVPAKLDSPTVMANSVILTILTSVTIGAWMATTTDLDGTRYAQRLVIKQFITLLPAFFHPCPCFHYVCEPGWDGERLSDG